MKSDLEIAQSVAGSPIPEIAGKLGIAPEFVEPYGKNKAKIALEAFNGRSPRAKLILVTAINPTKAGEGKTTCSIGLADSLALRGKKCALALREPSLGPVFGLKGGAAGGGYAQVIPMEEINLHFTGDLHAITAANNLIAACIDNHIHFGNRLDLQKIVFRRCLDINDRMLRDVTIRFKDEERKESFNITVASEIMAVFCLSENMDDLRARVSRIIIGYNSQSKPVTVGELGVTGSVVTLLKEALKPNLVQTLYHTPAFVHGGPFANIAHGCNSVIATKMAMSYADFVVTEAGFGADLGAEKFVDIKCRSANLTPDAVVVVATIRALKMHGGVEKQDLGKNDPEAVKRGFANFRTHVGHMMNNFGYPVPVVGALNRFASDTPEELNAFFELCKANGFLCEEVTSHPDGNKGAFALADRVLKLISEAPAKPDKPFFSYDPAGGIKESLKTLGRKFYNVSKIIYSEQAEKELAELENAGFGKLPVCVAKTPYALNDGSEDPDVLNVVSFAVSAGAGFVVAKTGEIVTMPGLPRAPLAETIDLVDGKIVGMI